MEDSKIPSKSLFGLRSNLLFGSSSDFLFVFDDLRLVDDDIIGDGGLDSELLSWIRFVGKHNLNLDSHDSLLEENVSDGDIDVVVLGLTSADHVSLLEFHGLGSLLLELTGDNDFATLSTILDNGLNNVVSSQSKRDVLEELVVHGFNLSGSAETLVLDGVSENLDLIIRVSESLLEELSEFLVFLSLNTNNLLGLS